MINRKALTFILKARDLKTHINTAEKCLFQKQEFKQHHKNTIERLGREKSYLSDLNENIFPVVFHFFSVFA